MIAHDHGVEAALKPHQRLGRVRAAVDQIADPEEAVGNGIKAKLGQRAVQRAKAAVDVANDKIAPAQIGANSAGPDTLRMHQHFRREQDHERREVPAPGYGSVRASGGEGRYPHHAGTAAAAVPARIGRATRTLSGTA